MIPIKEDTVYAWTRDYDSFSDQFKRFCVFITQAFNLDCRFEENELKLVHKKWIDECEIWRTQHFGKKADALSHIKIVALLLHHLSRAPFIASLSEYEYNDAKLKYEFTGNPEQKKEAADDLIAAREIILSLDFCISVICWYEENRIDRVEPFKFKMTVEFRHDIISFLVARGNDSRALYLILEALFLRTAKK